MKKQMICTALAVFVVTCAMAQSYGEIQGKVLDEKKIPAPGVIVKVSNGVDQSGDATNEEGRFRIGHLVPGSYDVTVVQLGMDTIRYVNVIVRPDIITTLPESELAVATASNYQTKAVDVICYVDPLIHRDADHIQTLRAEDLKHMPTTHGGKISNIVQSMSSDIKPSGEGSGMSVRGSREGGTLIYVDGVKVRNSDIAVPASGISSVSVYTAGIPAKYGDTTSGVIIVNTKSYTEDYYRELGK